MKIYTMNKQDLVSDIADIEILLDMAKECLITGSTKDADNLLRRVICDTKKVVFNIPLNEK